MKILFKNLLIIFIFFIVNISFSQVQEVTVDFLELGKIKDNLKKAEYGKKYRVKIININRSLYKISSSITQNDNNTKLPEIFKNIKVPSYLNLALPENSDISAVSNALSASPNQNADTTSYLNRYTKEIQKITTNYSEFQKIANLNNLFKNLYTSCDMPYDKIDSELVETAQKFVMDTSKDKKVLEKKINKKISKQIKNVITSSNNLENLLRPLIDTINKNIATSKLGIYEWESIQMKKTDPDYKDGYITYKLLIDDVDQSKKYIESLKLLKTKANKFVTEMRKFRDENKLQELIDNFNLINESNFTYFSKPIKVKKDEIKFDIKISSDSLLKCDRTNEVVILETVKTKGGLKVDFSSGIFFNGGNDDFFGRELNYIPVNDSISTIQSKDGGDRLLLGIGALMHIYIRSGKNLNWAISPGLSTTSEFDALNFHLGASAIFGQKNRLVLTGGITMRETNILDRNYDFNVEYRKDELPESPPSIKVFPKIGWFISLTYNFSKFEGQ